MKGIQRNEFETVELNSNLFGSDHDCGADITILVLD